MNRMKVSRQRYLFSSLLNYNIYKTKRLRIFLVPKKPEYTCHTLLKHLLEGISGISQR